MEILVLKDEKATQAKLVLKPGHATIKIPGYLTLKDQVELRNKLIKIADLNNNTKQFLKLYYKINTPYLFLNQKVSGSKKTFAVYEYNKL